MKVIFLGKDGKNFEKDVPKKSPRPPEYIVQVCSPTIVRVWRRSATALDNMEGMNLTYFEQNHEDNVLIIR